MRALLGLLRAGFFENQTKKKDCASCWCEVCSVSVFLLCDEKNRVGDIALYALVIESVHSRMTIQSYRRYSPCSPKKGGHHPSSAAFFVFDARAMPTSAGGFPLSSLRF